MSFSFQIYIRLSVWFCIFNFKVKGVRFEVFIHYLGVIVKFPHVA